MNVLADARFYVDEDISGLGIALMRLRSDVVLGGHEPLREFAGKTDPEWIPTIADMGLVVLTNDKRIRTRPDEAPLAIEHGLRCVHLDPHGRDPNQWDFLVQLIRHWPAVEEMCAEPGPIWRRARGSYFRQRPYQPGEKHRLPSD